jgi:small-conductance mechanosensitive channel
VQPGKQLGVVRAFNRLLKNRFDAEGIEIPFPHRTIYFGVDKQGAAPPAYVQVNGGARGSRHQASTHDDAVEEKGADDGEQAMPK